MSHVRQLSDAEAGKARERPVKKVCPAIDGVVCGWGFGHNRGRETGRGLLRRPRPFAEGRRARTGAHERGLCLTWADALLLRPTPTAASCTARPSAWECLSCRCRFPSMGRNVSKASTWMWSGSTSASATAATSSRRSRPSRRWANCGRNCCRNTTRWSISLCRAVFRVRARRPAGWRSTSKGACSWWTTSASRSRSANRCWTRSHGCGRGAAPPRCATFWRPMRSRPASISWWTPWSTCAAAGASPLRRRP